ncbi:hypothetical protein GCM10007908_12850 [Rhizobium albus]|nr:hypothetical protein GCM10007908_12850 [Rhizobium albus]
MNIEIDDALLADAMEALGTSTEKLAVEEALRRAVQSYRTRKAIEETAGLGWEGNLQEMRELRSFD